jgi:hypothetical protein
MSVMLGCMRTTLTLDDDVAAQLRRVLKARQATFKEVVNEALREGLKQLDRPPPRRTYRTPAVSLGRCLLGSVDDVAEALATAEGKSFR